MEGDFETNIQEKAEQPVAGNFIAIDFLIWFFAVSPKKIVEIWFSYLLANLHYFSIPLLLRTLAAPWHRDKVGYGRGFDFSRWSKIFIMNMIARGIGFVIRSVTIIIGLAVEIFIFCAGLLFLAFWISSPVICAVALIRGFNLIF